MSKVKSELIDQIYKNVFLCNKGHSVYWKGAEFLNSFSNLKICDKCGMQTTSEIPIRWACEECQFFICSKCYKLIVDIYCPKKHKLKYFKTAVVDFSNTFTCDNCFGKYEHKDGVLIDHDCNVTFCPKCYYDSSDVPEVIED